MCIIEYDWVKPCSRSLHTWELHIRYATSKISKASCLYVNHYQYVQIDHVTCDNASNNSTMLKEFVKHVWEETGQIFDPDTDCIQCI
jgi:hypothetical protein